MLPNDDVRVIENAHVNRMIRAEQVIKRGLQERPDLLTEVFEDLGFKQELTEEIRSDLYDEVETDVKEQLRDKVKDRLEAVEKVLE